MHVQDLKRWHWVAIALVVGLALSYVWTSVEPSIPRTMAPRTFEQLLATPPEQGRPWIANLTVHPPDEGVYIVTGEELTTQPGSKTGLYKPFQLVTRTPYVPGGGVRAATASGSNETIITYLDRVAAQHQHVRYRYAWERKPMWVYTFWTAGSLLLIGGVWPSLVSLLTGGGLGLTRETDDNGYDLSRFSSAPDPATAKPAATTGGAGQLAAVEAELEQKLAGFAITGAEDPAGAPGPGEPRKLDGKPLEPVPVPAEEEDKEYKGEFYPVARPHVPHHDAKKDN